MSDLASNRAKRAIPINAKQAALNKFAELKKGGLKRTDQFEVPCRLPALS